MYTLFRRPSVRLPFLMSLILGSIFLAQALPVSAHPPAGSPLRLRLRIERNTLPSGETTKVYAEFLDRDYQQVASDGTRVIEFGIAAVKARQSGSGELLPQRVTVRPGEWSGGTTFVSRQPGKLVITATSDGLDPAQALVLITDQQKSSLWQLIEPVAYAQGPNEIEIFPEQFNPAPANNKFQVKFQVSFSQIPPRGTVVRIATAPSAGIIYKDKQATGAMDITLDEGQGNSELIGIVSAAPGNVKVSATTRPDRATDSVEMTFEPPQPSKLVFDTEPQTIGLDERQVPVSVSLADDGGFPLALGADRERKISLTSATDSKLVDFEPNIIVLAKGRNCAQSVLRFKQVPGVNEMKLLAWDEEDTSIKAGQKIITILRPIPVSATLLLLAAVFGGAIGGIARQLHKVGRLDHIKPKWTGKGWDFGLPGRIMGSIVSGLFLYWAVKLGLAQVSFDLETKVVAFFLGGIGGFAGLVVLDRLVEWIFKLLHWAKPSPRRRVGRHQVASPAEARAVSGKQLSGVSCDGSL